MKADAAAAAAAAEVPGLVIRRYRGEADVPDLVRVSNAALEADGIPERRTEQDVAVDLRHASPAFDPATALVFAEIDGVVVGHGRADWVDMTDGTREYRTGGDVHPEQRRRGIGRAIMRTNLVRLREIDAARSTDQRRVFGLWTNERSLGAVSLARAEGFEPVRWFFEMERAGIDRDLPEIPPLPDGMGARPVALDEMWQFWGADTDAFQDHWGGFDASEENYRRWLERSTFRPELIIAAWEGDELAAGVVNTIYTAENEQLGMRRGWLDSVFTRRAWRRKGVAKALIARSMHMLAAEGMDTAMLGVDADNPSGALGLYESFGFKVVDRGTAWHRPLEDAS
ncbi:MAG: GNAT family N-acetyltransferase [Candidatus Limnocylindria bacterium]